MPVIGIGQHPVTAGLQPKRHPCKAGLLELFQTAGIHKSGDAADDKRPGYVPAIGHAKFFQVGVGTGQKTIVLKVDIFNLRVAGNGPGQLGHETGHTPASYLFCVIQPGKKIIAAIGTGKRAPPAAHDAVHRSAPPAVAL